VNNEKDKVKYVLLRAVGTSPTLLRAFHRSYGQQNIKLVELYEIAWELEKEGKLVCLDFFDDKYGDTICFKGGTAVIQPGLRSFSPQEQDLINALKSKGIMGEKDLSLLSGDNLILFVRTILEEFSSNSPADIKFEYNRWLIKFMNNEPPKE
jgi:hypothetical protein